MPRMRTRGFTLIDLAVILALTGILVAVFLPIANHHRWKRNVTATMAAGRAIYLLFSDTRGDEPYLGPLYLKFGPTDVRNDTFDNTTTFFTDAVTSGAIAVNFSFFAPHGVPPSRARQDWWKFQPVHNGWCVVGNTDANYPSTAPLLFTCNLTNFNTLDTPITALNGEISPDFLPWNRRAPFAGRQGFVFITRAGTGFGLHGELLKHASFTNLFQQTDTNGVRLTNPILRP